MTFTEDELKRAIREAQQPLVDRIDRIARQRALLLATAALGLIVAAVAVLYGINREAALKNQIAINQQVVCASAKTVATGYLQRLPGETKRHYINRLAAQYEQLLSSGNLECPSLPGFDTFPFLRAQTLQEIEDILRRVAPRKLKRPRGVARDGTGSQEGTTAEAVDELPSSFGTGGGTGGSGPSGGHGDSTGGSGPPSTSPDGPKGGDDTGKEDDGGGGDDGEGGTTPAPAAASPPAPPPAASPPASTPAAEEPKTPHNALSPVLDSTCALPVASALCTER